jgi:hypothetical protein
LFGDAAATNVTNTSNLFAIEWNKGIPNKDTISAASSFGTSTAADTNFYNWVKQYHKIIK